MLHYMMEGRILTALGTYLSDIGLDYNRKAWFLLY